MELTRLSFLALICLGLVGSDASQGEDYWHSVWPNTPLPKILSDLLLPYSEMPIKAKEEKQYWTIFFEHDLYPGKQMSLGIHEHSEIQHFQSRTTKAKHPLGILVWGGTREKETQPFEARTQGTREKANQPFGFLIWEQREKANQPFGARTWGTREKTNQPSGFVTLEREKESQPFGARTWGSQKKESQPLEVHTQKIEKDIINEFCVNPSAIGEDKYCALSLESMMDFAISKLGMNIKVISSSFAKNQDQYVVEEVKKIGDKAVMCHRMNFEKVFFYCHEVNATTSYMVPLVAPDGTKVEALTICHHDTRGMDPDMLYKVLKVKPGTIPVCHFVGNKAIAWVPNRDANHVSSGHPCVT